MTPDRPFPWRCLTCRAKEVYPKATDYRTIRKHDGREYAIHIPDLEIPTCRQCGEQVIADDGRIIAALRAQVGLLTPEEMQCLRAGLGMTQQELAEQLGVAKESICRWETGNVMQSRAMDNLMRLFFESKTVRKLLRRFRPEQPLAAG